MLFENCAQAGPKKYILHMVKLLWVGTSLVSVLLMKAFSNVIIAMFRNICMSARASVYALYVFMFRFFFLL